MAVLLFSVGIIALVAGLVMVGFGIPINEFSFGNTLISAGTTAAVGGLIIIALGVTVGQLRRIAESLANPMAGRYEQPIDISEPGDAPPLTPAPGRPSFPPRQKSEKVLGGLGSLASVPANVASDDEREQFVPPRLRNPDETPVSVDDEISLSPSEPSASASTGRDPFVERSRPGVPPPTGGVDKSFADKGQDPPAGWPSSAPTTGLPPRPIQPARFDAMWPAEPRSKSDNVDEAKQPAMPARGQPVPAPKRTEPEAPKPRAVAILKSGVVDGMGYTLYVDGSIEAELPQGTLRFASINELRSHLEKNS